MSGGRPRSVLLIYRRHARSSRHPAIGAHSSPRSCDGPPRKRVRDHRDSIREIELVVGAPIEKLQVGSARTARQSRRIAQEEVSEEADRIRDVNVPVLVAISRKLPEAAGSRVGLRRLRGRLAGFGLDWGDAQPLIEPEPPPVPVKIVLETPRVDPIPAEVRRRAEGRYDRLLRESTLERLDVALADRLTAPCA